MITLAKEKKVLLEEMLSLSEQEINVIKGEKFEELEKLLDKKDLIIEKINDIDTKLKVSRLEDQEEDQELLKALSQINEVLIKIKTLDDINNKELSDAMTTIKGDLKEVRQGKRAMDNYSNSNPYHAFASQGGTLFVDQES